MSGRLARVGWLLVAAAGLAVVLLASPRTFSLPIGGTALALPGRLGAGGAVLLTACGAVAVAARTGGRVGLSGLLALVLACAAVLSGSPVLVAGAAVTTAVLSGVLGLLVTIPAGRLPGLLRECALASAIAAVGACAVVGYHPEVSFERVRYLSIGLSLAVALLLAQRLAHGRHALTRRGEVMLVTGVVAVVLAVGYAEALARWGPAELLSNVELAVAELPGIPGVAPVPLVAFVGVPALAWGVFTRSRFRDGWWACAFAAPGLAEVAASLLHPTRSPAETAVALTFSIAVGLGLGLILIGIDRFFSGGIGRRRTRRRQVTGHCEPGRAQALL